MSGYKYEQKNRRAIFGFLIYMGWNTEDADCTDLH